jgi:UDP-GlcNAc:undecaprenyl-phosphate/decaprenyl-phosphate GlcNAc-1-phosphate transferase
VKMLITFVLGAATAYGLWTVLQPLFARPALQRKNHRGRELPTAAGLVIVLAPLPLIALWSAYDTIRDGYRPDLDRSWTTTVIVVVGFGLFGLLDDLLGDGGPRGFAGHVQAATRGELTTGLVKLVGGGLVAVAAAAPWAADRFSHLVVGSLVIALAANLGNLLDRAPGRIEKVSTLAFVVLAAGTVGAESLAGPALVVGAGAAMLVPDLRERCMLGDTGANVLGAAVGLGVVASTGTAVNAAVAIVLLVLNVASEFVSFSAVIDRTRPLRWADRLGAPPR